MPDCRPLILAAWEVRQLIKTGSAEIKRTLRPGPVALRVSWTAGQRLWGREDFSTRQEGPAIKIRFRADGDHGETRFVPIALAGKQYVTQGYVSRKSKHMPRWASRFVVEIVEVREEAGQTVLLMKLVETAK